MWRIAAKYSAVGLEMGIAICLGWYGGTYLDEKLGTKPYLSYILLGCGIVAGFLGLYKLARDFRRDSATKPPT